MNVPSSSFAQLSISVNDSEAANHRQELLEDLRNGLNSLRTPAGSKKLPRDPNALKVKLEYCGEKRCISMRRPVQMTLLLASIQKLFGRQMNVYYVQGRSEVLVSIRNQEDLDGAIEVVDRGEMTSLRLLLSKHEGGRDTAAAGWRIQPDQSGTYSNVVEVPYTESCSSCGVARMSLAARSVGGGDESTCSSGVQLDSDDWRFSAPSPRAPANWRKGKQIGSGAFGSVYVAHDVDTGRDMALKRIPLIPENRENIRDAKGLEYDVRELARLQHPRILQYLGVQKAVDAVLIFMEYMAGGSVKDLIKIQGKLSARLAKRYTGQVLEGVAFLHKKSIVHRDIKPANILRDLDGNVKIADFGSGKKIQALASQQGQYNGTIHYTAPEVLLGKSAYGRKADVWSVGVSLVEMLTGQVPWHDLQPMVALFQIAYETPIIEFSAEVDGDLQDLVSQLMRKEFEKRPMAEEVLLNHPVFN